MNNVMLVICALLFVVFTTGFVYYTSEPKLKEKRNEEPFTVIVLGISAVLALAIAASIMFLQEVVNDCYEFY